MRDLLTPFHADISEEIWQKKYRYQDKFTGEVFDQTVEDTWKRIATTLASVEDNHIRWEGEFYDALSDFKFLPAGRIIAGAGTDRRVTLFNCYVMGIIPDSMNGIFSALREAALTMQQGGGIGYDFSTLRPKGAQVQRVAADASGPLTFMDVWDSMCRTVMSAGSRRGAMMATMRCDHPDIEDYIIAKQDSARLRMFNMSVLVTDKFMEAVEKGELWDLTFDGKTYKTVSARTLWDKIMHSTYAFAEPGVIFIDRINQDNNLKYMETISATNPCGEQPLPPYGACLLGSINLAALVKSSYTSEAHIDEAGLKKLVRVAVRMMDNVNDVSEFPLVEQLDEAQAKRRIGLGVTGLADALMMCNTTYGTDAAVDMAEEIMNTIALTAYQASIDLAREKGPFPALRTEEYLSQGQFADLKLPPKMKQEIREVGIRNSHLLSIAPTGTISLYAGNVSSGIEPIFAPSYTRKTLQDDGSKKEQRVVDYAVAIWEDHVKNSGEELGDLPPSYVDAQTLPPADHVRMQAAVQKWVDTSISKTINVPEDADFETFKEVYRLAYDSGCKGCTTYRPNKVTGSVIEVEKKPEPNYSPSTEDLMKRGGDWLKGPNPVERKETLKRELKRLGIANVAEAKSQKHRMHLLDLFLSDITRPAGGPAEEAVQDRPLDLPGQTYKVKLGDEPAFYVTVSDIEECGERRPFEVFIASKNPAHMQWTNALALMVSAVFRRPHDASFVVEELKSVFDPKGGGFWQGKYWNSTVAAIGRVIEIHMIRIGYINDPNVPHELSGGAEGRMSHRHPNPQMLKREACPKCFSGNLKHESGCLTCLDCGNSKCG